MKLRQERTRREWRTIEKASGALRTKSISVVEVVRKGREIETKGKEDTKSEILDCLVEHFGRLISKTPVMVGELAANLGHLCENKELTNALLSRNADLSRMDEDLVTVIRLLGPRHKEINCSVS